MTPEGAKATSRIVSQSISQPAIQSVSQSVSLSVSQPASQPVSQLVSQSASQSVSQSASQPVSQSVKARWREGRRQVDNIQIIYTSTQNCTNQSLEGVCETHVIPAPGAVRVGLQTALRATIIAGPAGPIGEFQKANRECRLRNKYVETINKIVYYFLFSL